jgi:transcription elongation factor Elf1
MEMSKAKGTLTCRVCAAGFSMPVHYLNEPVDVFCEWLDECERLQKEGGGPVAGGSAEIGVAGGIAEGGEKSSSSSSSSSAAIFAPNQDSDSDGDDDDLLNKSYNAGGKDQTIDDDDDDDRGEGEYGEEANESIDQGGGGDPDESVDQISLKRPASKGEEGGDATNKRTYGDLGFGSDSDDSD